MTVLLWNIQGVGTNEFVPHLKTLLHIHNPDIVILLETKAGEDKARQDMKQLGFCGYKVAPLVGRKGGIWMIWKTNVQLINFMGPSNRYFHYLFKIYLNSPKIVITGVHAPTNRGEKK